MLQCVAVCCSVLQYVSSGAGAVVGGATDAILVQSVARADNIYIFTNAHKYAYACIYMYVYTYTNLHMHIYVCMYIHV